MMVSHHSYKMNNIFNTSILQGNYRRLNLEVLYSPKSANFNSPLSLMSRFCGLRSLQIKSSILSGLMMTAQQQSIFTKTGNYLQPPQKGGGEEGGERSGRINLILYGLSDKCLHLYGLDKIINGLTQHQSATLPAHENSASTCEGGKLAELFLLFFQRFFNNNIKQGSLGQGNRPAPKLVGKFCFTLDRRPKICLTPMLVNPFCIIKYI